MESAALTTRASPPTDAPALVPALTLDSAFRRYAPYVAAVGLRLLGRRDEVDDLVQDVFLEAARGLEALREPQAARSWLATVAVRLASRRLKRRRIRAFFGLDDATGYDDVADASASPEQRALLAQAYRVLDRLPVEQRLAWALRYIEGERLDAVAQLCGCSLATAKRRIATAHAAVQREVDGG